MANRWATQTFNIQLATGSHTVIEGSLRDSTHGAVTGASALFTTTPPVLGQGHVNDKLFAYLQANPKGPGELWERGSRRTISSVRRRMAPG